jgi:MFS family permease
VEWQLWLALVLFTVVEGLFPVTWATVGDFFGRNNFAKVRGSMSFLYMWGSVIGPVIAGAVYDRTQSYSPLVGTDQFVLGDSSHLCCTDQTDLSVLFATRLAP